jgi:hypothetical protein
MALRLDRTASPTTDSTVKPHEATVYLRPAKQHLKKSEKQTEYGLYFLAIFCNITPRGRVVRLPNF